MKKELLTTLVVLSLCFSLNAQRNADLRLRVDYPGDTAYIKVNKQYPFRATIFNDGTDTVRLSDTIAMYLIFDGDTALSFDGIFRKYRVLSVHLVPGDSMVIDEPGVFTNSSSQPINYCIFIRPINYTDPIDDNHLANNKSCATVFVGNKSNLQSIGGTSLYLVYPNPVTGAFSIRGGDDILSYRMTDMQGREVNLVRTGPAEFDCSNIGTKGLYLLSVTSAQGTSVIKIIIAR